MHPAGDAERGGAGSRAVREGRGDQGQGHEETRDEGEGDGEGLIPEDLPRHALHEDEGEEDGDRRERRRDDSADHLPRPHDRGDGVAISALAKSRDRLEHHDRVVDEHADPEGESAEGHHVEGDVEDPHQQEGDGHRDRDREGDDSGREEVAQEEVEDEGGEERAEERARAHVRHRLLDVARLIEQDPELGPPQPLLPGHRGEALSDPAGDLHRVRVPLLVDMELDRRHALHPDPHLAVIGPADDAAQVPDTDHAGLGVAHDRLRDRIEVLKLVHGAEPVGGVAIAQLSAGAVDVLLRDPAAHLVDREPESAQALILELDPDLLLRPSDHARRRHALEGLEALRDDRVREATEFPRVVLPLEGDPHHGIEAGVEAIDHR